ncbi:MAG: GDSL-type esterase/lipase family protein [Bacteroidia bacterium]
MKINKYNLFTFLTLCFCGINSFGQNTYILIDFGSIDKGYLSHELSWNNVTNPTTASVKLIDDLGNSTNSKLTITDGFTSSTTLGISNSNGSASIFPTSATIDGFYGNAIGTTSIPVNPTAGFTFSGLDTTKYYSFTVFASRLQALDNRETLYTITGRNSLSASLNATNNSSKVATFYNIKPLLDGTIYFEAKAGINNNNTSGFYYLNALRMVVSNRSINEKDRQPFLKLLSPNGGEKWEIGKLPKIEWQSRDIDSISVEYSTNNGTDWKRINTVAAKIDSISLYVSNLLSKECRVRLISKDTIIETENNFSFIPNEGKRYGIVVLGSSTAAGAGATTIQKSWVWLYKDFLKKDTRYELINLAVSGFTTYNILPTGTIIPTGISQVVNLEHNINKALSYKPDAIIVNLPSNDLTLGYPNEDQINNYKLIRDFAIKEGVPVWITTPQPINNKTNTIRYNLQVEMVKRVKEEFGDNVLDFYTDMGIGSNLKPLYDSGDGTHLNNAGHQELFKRVISKDIHNYIVNVKDSFYSLHNYNNDFYIFPNPILNSYNINFTSNNYEKVSIRLLNLNGQVLFTVFEGYLSEGLHSIEGIKNGLTKGIYLCNIKSLSYNCTKKIIFS